MTRARQEQISQIEDLFRKLNWQGRRQFARRLEKFGLTVPQYLALSMIGRLGPVATMSEVSDALQLPRSSMTSITDRLVELGLAQRGTLESDRRAVIASITQAGADLVGKVEAINTADLTRILKALSENDLEHFVHVLRWLLNGVEGDLDADMSVAGSDH